LPDQAKELCKLAPKHMDSGYLDVTDSAAIEKAI